jgi:hypothetical protein
MSAPHGSYGVFFGSTPTQTGDSSVAQALTVPITLSSPTLSFFYRLGGASPTSGTRFSVEVANGVTAATLFSTTADTADWTHCSICSLGRPGYHDQPTPRTATLPGPI